MARRFPWQELAVVALVIAIIGAWVVYLSTTGDSDMTTSPRIAENTLYAGHGWHCTRQDAEMVHVNDDPNFHGDAMTVRCTRFERDHDGPTNFKQRWHVWSRDGFLPKGATEDYN